MSGARGLQMRVLAVMSLVLVIMLALLLTVVFLKKSGRLKKV